MKKSRYIAYLALMLITIVSISAQTPFDDFSPETSRIILDSDSIAAWRAKQNGDTFYCAIIADLHNRQLLLVDVRNKSVLAYVPFSKNIRNWMSVDPLTDEYISASPYLYCNGNPVMLVDPDGRYVEVSLNDDGTYTVENGIANRDRNIYVVKDGKRTGDILGVMATQYSFFDDNQNIVKDAVIDLSDKSGKNFLDNFCSNPPCIADYCSSDRSVSGRNGGCYDFKSNGAPEEWLEKGNEHQSELLIYYNRGMSVSLSGKKVIGTARDVGNYAAGYLCGINGVDFILTRLAFDFYQGGIEPPVSRKAQNLGYRSGLYIYLLNSSMNVK